MANTIVTINQFEDIVLKVCPFVENVINVKPFDDFVVVVPVSGEDEGFDYILDLIFR